MLGVILLVLGFLLGVSTLWAFGIILIMIGVVFARRPGRPIGGRRCRY